MKTLLKLIILFVVLLTQVQAQTNDNSTCVNNLATANTLYEKAQFTEAISMIEPCIKSGSLKNYLADAYRILGLCYHQLGDESKRNEAVLNLLKKKPNYQLFPLNDPKDFTNIVNTYKVQSKLFAGIKVGFNYSLPNITEAYSVKPATLEIEGNRGQFLGFNIDYFFKGKSLSIGGWGTSSQLSYTQNVTFNEVEKINYKEELKVIDVGLEAKYYPLKKYVIHPYVGIGFSTLFLRNGLSNSIYTNSYLNLKTESSRDIKEEKITNNVLMNGILDLGISTKAGKGSLGVGFQYVKAFTNSHNPDMRYEKIDYILSNQWVDSDVKINYLNIYATYSFPLLWRVYK